MTLARRRKAAKRTRRRSVGLGPWLFWGFCLCGGLLLTAGFLYWSHITTDKYRGLIETGRGDVRFVAAISAPCQPHPRRRRYGRGGGAIPWGRRVEIVAQENGFGLTSHLDQPCWLELWTLRAEAPVFGPGLEGRNYAQPPPGWRPDDP